MRIPPAVLALILTSGVMIHVGAPALPAQQSAVAPGTKVRFALRSGDRLEGRVVSLRPEALEAAIPKTGTTARYLVTDIDKLEIVHGRHRPVLHGAALGTGVGIILGGALGAMTYSPCESTEFLGCLLAPTSRMQSAAMGATVLGIAGLVVGGVQGLIPRDRWRRVQVDGDIVRFSMRTLPGSETGIGLALAF